MDQPWVEASVAKIPDTIRRMMSRCEGKELLSQVTSFTGVVRRLLVWWPPHPGREVFPHRTLTCAEALLSPTGAAGVAIKDPASLREGAGLLVCLKPVGQRTGGHSSQRLSWPQSFSKGLREPPWSSVLLPCWGSTCLWTGPSPVSIHTLHTQQEAGLVQSQDRGRGNGGTREGTRVADASHPLLFHPFPGTQIAHKTKGTHSNSRPWVLYPAMVPAPRLCPEYSQVHTEREELPLKWSSLTPYESLGGTQASLGLLTVQAGRGQGRRRGRLS